eukprot:1607375-Pyramimonas_sp.AAC.1
MAFSEAARRSPATRYSVFCPTRRMLAGSSPTEEVWIFVRRGLGLAALRSRCELPFCRPQERLSAELRALPLP